MVSEVSEESREILKLEARLASFLRSEEAFVDELRGCLEKFRELNEKTSEIRSNPDNIKEWLKLRDPSSLEEWMKLRTEAVKALSETLKKESKAEHERSHLLESYAALILALEFNPWSS